VVRPYFKRLFAFGEEIDTLKILKLKTLSGLADESNFDEIFKELSYYVEQENELF
jgi:hypothetical protein